MMKQLYFLVVLSLLHCCQARIYQRCELAEELVNRFNFDRNVIGDWVCLAEHESSLNTAALGGPNFDGSYDHGLFQINDFYWCAPPGPNNECGVTCDALRTDDITAAANCALKIFGVQGFEAWFAWQNNCRDQDVSQYIAGCNI